jgi:hypothetical protein
LHRASHGYPVWRAVPSTGQGSPAPSGRIASPAALSAPCVPCPCGDKQSRRYTGGRMRNCSRRERCRARAHEGS